MIFSGPKPPERRPTTGEFQRVLDDLIEQAQEAILWEFRLDWNEVVWGSAYGPWPPLNLRGLEPLISGESAA